MKNNIINILLFIIIPFVFLLLYLSNNLMPTTLQENLGHILAFVYFSYIFYELNKKTKVIKLLNNTLKEKERLSKELTKSNKKLEKLATLDFLTGIGNRRYYFDLGEKAFALAKRDNQFLSIITIDIDDFKEINDKFGHQVGDDILKLVANNMKLHIRKSDILARVGGEEFSIILPKSDLEDALIIAEKVRETLNSIVYEHNNIKVSVTASFGVSQIIYQSDTDLDDIYARSDKALYKAKSSGKNRVCYA